MKHPFCPQTLIPLDAVGVIAWTCILTVVLATSVLAQSKQETPPPLEFVKGISWGWVGSRGEYSGPAPADSMRKLAETNANCVCICFAPLMETYDNPEFRWGNENLDMVSDAEIRRAIHLARENNLKVILKPMINCNDGVWRAWIRFFRPMTDEEQASGVPSAEDPWGETPGVREGMVVDLERWNTWWKNYDEFLLHYAKLAAEENVEMFCLGCEMNSTEEFVDRWRELITRVRGVYSGPLIYDCNHGREAEVPWWDAVDVMGVSAYYQVPPPEGQTEEEAIRETTPKEQLVATFTQIKQHLAELHEQYGKPILFVETGVTSVRGCARYPWSHPGAHPDSPTDQQEQVNYYEAMFEVFWKEPWFLGFAWWDWPARLYPLNEAAEDRGFTIYGKPAEQIVRDWYAKNREFASSE